MPLQLLEFSSANDLVRFIRISKLHRLIKVLRVTRLLKIVTAKSRIGRYINTIFKEGFGGDKLIFALLMFLLLCHIASCGWIVVALYEEENFENTWINDEDVKYLGGFDLYVASFYFTVTTITTVGYGDIHAYSKLEFIIGIILKIFGVIGFSFASGALSAIIQNLDATQAKLQEKMQTLTKIQQEHNIPHNLYQELKQAI